jgi:hypothetical protein
MPPEIARSIATYARYGLNYGPADFLNFDQTPQTFQHAEIVDFNLVFVCNHTQVYLKNYKPIAVDIQVSFSLFNRNDGASLDHFLCSGSASMITSLPANVYASISQSSFTICPNTTLSSISLRTNVAVKNETGQWITFVAETPSFTVVAASHTRLSLQNQVDESLNIVVKRMLFPTATFRLSSNTSCDRVQFRFEAKMSCVLSKSGKLNSSVLFYTNGDVSTPSLSLQGIVSRSCVFDVGAIIPSDPGLCFLVIAVPTFPGVFAQSFNISVVNDDPFAFEIVGVLAARLDEGEVIWSVNNSVSKCLQVVLYDKHGNLVLQCQGEDFGLVASVFNDTRISKYALFGPTRGVSDCRGRMSWCSTHVTLSGIIQLNISSPYFNRIIPAAINVSGQGAAAKIAVLTPTSQISSTVLAGGTMSSVSIQVTNAVGVALRKTDNIVVKIRVLPKNASTSRCELDRCIASILIMFCRVRSRLLLSALEPDSSTACPGGGDRIFNAVQQSSSGALVIQNVTLCVAGDNEISYDIGFLDEQGLFVPIVINAYSSEIRVLIGDANGFLFVAQELFIELTNTRAKSRFFVVTHDQGRNVRI